MAKITLGIDTRTSTNGMCAVRIRISHLGTNAFISTGVKVEPEYFYPSDLRTPISKRAYMAKSKNEQIAMLVRKFDEAIFDMERADDIRLDDMSANDIRDYIIGERAPRRKRVAARTRGRIDFMNWLDRYAMTKEKEKTRYSYQYTWRLLGEYCKANHIDRIYFDDLNYSLFVDIKSWLTETGRGESVRHQVESNMHAAWNEACRMRMVDRSSDPWLDYPIERVEPPMEIEFAPIQDLQKALRHDISGTNGEEWLQTVKDLVMLSWYFCGANLKDIYYMPKPKDGEFVFVRQKSQTEKKTKKGAAIRPVHIRIEPELQAMLKKYAGHDGAFCFRDRVPNYATFQRKVLDRLDRLCKLSGVSFDFRMLRRSWGTYALQETHDKWVVDNSMGHQPDSILMKHYGAYNWSDTAKCNRQMIDLLMSA